MCDNPPRGHFFAVFLEGLDDVGVFIVVFDGASALLHKAHRDTLKFAFKCSAIQINGGGGMFTKTP